MVKRTRGLPIRIYSELASPGPGDLGLSSHLQLKPDGGTQNPGSSGASSQRSFTPVHREGLWALLGTIKDTAEISAGFTEAETVRTTDHEHYSQVRLSLSSENSAIILMNVTRVLVLLEKSAN